MTRSFDWIAHHARTRPTKLASLDLATGRRFTYDEMNERCNRLAAALRDEFAINFGDRVAVLANNNTNFYEVQFACWKLGAIFVPLNWRLAIPELEFIVGDAGAKVLIVDDDFAGAGDALVDKGIISQLLNWDQDDGYERAIADATPLEAPAQCELDTPVTIMYTSGTTGRPKGAIITQGMVFYNAINCTEFLGLSVDMVHLTVLPCFHTAGLNILANPAYHYGATNLVMRTFDPGETLRLFADTELGITHFMGVPTNYLFLSQHPDFATTEFAALKYAPIGGAPTPLPLLQAWEAKGLPLQQAFGMTETSPAVSCLKPEDCTTKIGSAGLPVLHNEIRVVNEAGDDAKVGETGELWVRGPNVTPGYWNFPEANETSFVDGYLKTGDAAKLDEDGFLYIVDRWKDMYISGGENVYPAEVETVIHELDQVGQAAIIGVADDKWGEVGRAIIVRKPDVNLDEATVIEHCATKLATFKVPTSVMFVDELPMNATGKVLKRELRISHGS